MESYIIKHPKYKPGKWLMNITQDGKEYHLVEWESSIDTPFGEKPGYIDKLPVEECRMERKPSRGERIFIIILHKIFGSLNY